MAPPAAVAGNSAEGRSTSSADGVHIQSTDSGTATISEQGHGMAFLGSGTTAPVHKVVAPNNSGSDRFNANPWYDPTDLFALPFNAHHDDTTEISSSARSPQSLAASSYGEHVSGFASEYARLRAEVVDLARRAGVSGRSVEDLRRAIHTLRSTSEGTFVSICDRVTQINIIAKDATAADWGTWKNEWACAYDGKVHGSFMTATDALDDMKQGVIWQSSFKWFISDSPATSSSCCESEVVHAGLPPPQGAPASVALGR